MVVDEVAQGPAEPPGSTARRRLLAGGLFLLAPFVGEFVLGNQAITSFPSLLIYAPMYGGGALLVREVARRWGAGWPAIIALAAAYALLEEGPIDQMLMNPAYLGLDAFTDFAPIPGLGISAQLAYESLSIHTVWSICVPIAIMEAFDPAEPRPWLGRFGLGVVAAVFVVGSTGLAVVQYAQFRFLATPLQFAALGAVIVGLVLLALTVLRRWNAPARSGSAPAPRPGVVGVAAFGLASLYWAVDMLVPEAWWAVACWALQAVVAAIVLARCSGRPGWGRRHRLAVAGGVVSTYLWVAFVNSAELGLAVPLAVTGNVVFGLAAIILLLLAVRAERRRYRVSCEPRSRAGGRSGLGLS